MMGKESPGNPVLEGKIRPEIPGGFPKANTKRRVLNGANRSEPVPEKTEAF